MTDSQITTNLIIRGLNKKTKKHITDEAKRLSMTQNQYCLNRVTALVHGELEQRRYPFDEALDETITLLNINFNVRQAIYRHINELERVHDLNREDE